MAEALKNHLNTLAMLRTGGPEEKSQEIATALKNVGMAYQELGDVKKALEYFEDALKMERGLYPGQNHLDVAETLSKLGLANEALENFSKAIKHHEEALEIRRAIHAGNHRDIAFCLVDLADDHEKLGDYSKALKYFGEALEMQKALDGETAWILDMIGAIYCKLGNVEEIINYAEQGLEIKQKLLQEGRMNYNRIANSLNNLGDAYAKFGDTYKAAECFKQAYILDTKTVNSPDFIETTKRFVECNYPDFIRNNEAREFIVPRGTFEKSTLQIKQKLYRTVLSEICKAAPKGSWSSKSILGFRIRGVQDYCDESYLRQQLGNLSSPATLEIAKMLCFEAICLGSIGSSSRTKNFICAKEFANAYPKVIENVIRDHPEYFVDGSILRQCVNDKVILYKLLNQQSVAYQTHES